MTLHRCNNVRCRFTASIEQWEDGGIDSNEGRYVICPCCYTWLDTETAETYFPPSDIDEPFAKVQRELFASEKERGGE